MGIKLQLTVVILCALFTSLSALYSEWNSWGPCSKSCNGEQNRTRSCHTITLQPCEGKIQKRNCNASGCYPSSEFIITSAVLGTLILLLLVVLIVIIIKTRNTSRTLTKKKNRENVLDFENTASNGRKDNSKNFNKNIAQRTSSATPSTVSQVTYLQTDAPAGTVFKPWGQKDCDLY
ncbi:uncharacterized protein LOC116289984 [Actinia tenebrosa]|uniref:Uncharacterized protein LOC116289984 n=1 Tax=Actinia tenebrosa TaxID=6105 RepID=A0A6P8HB13_ACTTE|nr:uncharacterized protein LOC116289984 [Actinia tenebrosa]